MKRKSLEREKIQQQIFAQYTSLDLQNKLYQVKALKLAQKYLGKKKETKLLDIGCSDGSFAQYAGRLLRAKTYGVDISAGAIKLAKTRLGVAMQHNGADKLPFPDKSFDLIFALEIIEHIYDTDFFLAEIHRVLKVGGKLILSTPNLASLKNRLKLLINGYPQYLEYSTTGAGHIHLYTSPVLSGQLQQNGLQVIELRSANFLAPWVTNRWAPMLYRQIASLLGDYLPTLGSHLIVVAGYTKGI